MNVLLIGSGGREHALAWALTASPLLTRLVCAPGNGGMLALLAADRATVDRAHATALRLGGQCEGPPGLRPHYHENYYGAFILDPDGHNIEAVNHLPE